MGTSDQGFVQDYAVGRRQELFIYCRLCRRIFPVIFKPRPTVRLRCTCGHEAPLAELDVFDAERAAREHAQFYEKVYQAAKSALREAGVPLPPSGKFRLSDFTAPGSVSSADTPEEDASDIRSSYREPSDESDVTPASMSARLDGFDARLAGADDPFERHEVLSELIEWAFVRRHKDPTARARLLAACHDDIALATRLVDEARRRLKSTGERVRLSFTSFKHLALVHEEDGELEEALAVAERAAALGLKGYAERADELRRRRG
ncbi:MAG: hypothetical protein KF878_37170 [Planctomycetes bacterium]|nr:hypothetical protein [Planctomycetota bacterium]